METGFTLALSILIGGVFFLTLMQFNANLTQTAIMNNMDYSAQVKLSTLVDIVKHDLNKIGYLNDPDESGKDEIINSTNNSIKFSTSLNDSFDNPRIGSIELSKENDRLVRTIYDENGNELRNFEINGLDSLHIDYIDEDADGNLDYLTVTIISTLSEDYDPGQLEQEYSPEAFWESDIYPRNLNRN